ncbi:MAG: hypothetical protein QOH59_289 [Gemmatimonadales bacterium]|nr:hypothetical protein [Gemmatimonadales bacterium]
MLFRSAPRFLQLLVLGLAACTGESRVQGSGSNLTVTGSAGAAPVLFAGLTARSGSSPSFSNTSPVTTGDPAAVRIGMYGLWISPNGDCSNAILVQDYGATASIKDFVQTPVLFSADATEGSYQCLLVRMSDVIGFTPATTFGNCTAGADYEGDVYREGESDWKDVDLNTITGTGTDEVPSDDRVTLVMTTDTAAAQARGFSTHQTLLLASPLVVPAATTFYWNGGGSVTSEGSWPCGLNPGQPTFE